MRHKPVWSASWSINTCECISDYIITNPHAAADQAREQFVESELARRYAAEKISQSSTPQEAARRTAATSHSGPPSSKNPLPDQPVMQGKLQEIDLGDEARMRNVAMTDRARRQLQGEDVVDNESSGRPKKVRLGKDGKPWRPRKRRGSDDVKRDQLVEEFLRENRRKSSIYH